MNTQLLITNIGHIISIIITLSLGILVYSRGIKKPIHQIFFLFCLSIVIWETSYLSGINIADPTLSRFAFMFNSLAIFVTIFNAHLILLLTNQYEKHKKIISTIYTLGVIKVVFFSIFPNLFLEPSEPKLYFVNFFVPGKYYFVGDILFFSVIIYLIYLFFSSYKKADYMLKNRLKYFIVAIIFGYSVALTPEFLLYGIEIDPFISFLFGLYIIPMAYSIIVYDLIDIHIVAKRAFWYSLCVALIALIISFIGNANVLINKYIPDFPGWIIPTLSSILAVSTAVFVWKKIRGVDVLKNEFINIIMHKFRTPLTYIKWSLETLKAYPLPENQKKEIGSIEESNARLVELTNAVVNLANVDSNEHFYNFSLEDMENILSSVLANHQAQIRLKKIIINKHIDQNLPCIYMDTKRMEFVITTIIDNAITYTKEGGNIDISLTSKNSQIIFTVKDDGTGISREDLRYIFTKFYRGAGMKIDTEGMGIALFLSQDIVKRHRGKISVTSEGINKGSIFSIHLPVKK